MSQISTLIVFIKSCFRVYLALGPRLHSQQVFRSNNVLVTSNDQHTVVEYDTNGDAVRTINLLSIGIVNPWHCVQLKNGLWAVSNNHAIHVVDLSGRIVHEYGGSIGLNSPVGLALGRSGDILVANQDANKLLVLNSSLTTSSELALPNGVTLNNPRALFLDSSHGRLNVGEWSGYRVVLLDNVYKGNQCNHRTV
jgi:hypothetical protein